MPLKQSWMNRELVMQMMRSSGWISIIYLLGLLFVLPFQILMAILSEESLQNYDYWDTFFQYDYQLQFVMMITVPVALTVFLFRFLHVKQAADHIHSLPIKRERIFHHYALTGIVFLLAPIVINAVVLLIIQTVHDLSSLYTIKDIFYWAGTTSVMVLLIYTASMLVAMMTGISAVHTVLAYILLLFPSGILVLLFSNFELLLYGFPSEYFLNQRLDNLSPITFALSFENRLFQWSSAILYLILTVVLYVGALYLYKKRNLESASEAIAFPKMRFIFKYGVSFCFMLLGGVYFHSVSYQNFGWTVFGYVLGAAAGYYAAEMLLQKTWRVFTKFKGLVVLLTITALLVIGSQSLGFYEKKVPNQDEIKNVLLIQDPSFFYRYNEFIDYNLDPKPLKELENIEAVTRLHKQILADQKVLRQRKNDRISSFYFMYELNNGHKVIREYRIVPELYEDLFKPIYESDEYKKKTEGLFLIDETKVNGLHINANGPFGRGVTFSNPNDVKDAISHLKKDLLAESYEDSIYYQGRGSSIELLLENDQSINLELKPIFKNMNNWLEEKNLLEQAKVTADDFSKVLVVQGEFKEMDTEQIKRAAEQMGNALEITDKQQIEEALNNSGYNVHQEDYTAVFFYTNDHNYEVFFLDDTHAPSWMKEHFK